MSLSEENMGGFACDADNFDGDTRRVLQNPLLIQPIVLSTTEPKLSGQALSLQWNLLKLSD